MATAGQIIVPGQHLGPASKYVPGPGTHLVDGQVYASLLGRVQICEPAGAAAAPALAPAGGRLVPGMLPKRLTRITVPTRLDGSNSRGGRGDDAAADRRATVTVTRAGASGADTRGGGGRQEEVLPDVGHTVLCRVTRITQRQAVVAILVVGETVQEAAWQGLIRAQDVRATEKDRVRVYEAFRPGDIVRAQVISLGDQANYYLSTASNALGVVMATSEAGNPMYPVSWKEYIDPETGLSEPRKVARPF